MKPIAAFVLTLATLASAVPNAAEKNAAAVLSTRQTSDCTYDCLCQDDKEGDGPNSSTGPCCSTVGGTLGNEGTLCNDMSLATAQNYAKCCVSSPGTGGFVCFQSGDQCPPVTIN